MKKRRLPIPLILLIPVVMLAVVIVAGMYRFSLTDEEIMAKFSHQQMERDALLYAWLGISTPNPLTLNVPESRAFAFIDEYDSANGLASGQYDAGAERGRVTLFTQFKRDLSSDEESWFSAPFMVSNQGSGRFYYLGLFKYDPQPRRVIMIDSILLGDRIELEQSKLGDNKYIEVTFLQHAAQQSYIEQPLDRVTQRYERVGNKLKQSK
ncbi:hypothetical protein BOO22_07395 [Vibrio cidicii]|uniref:hypothetical protein n=1 Tax=Vibrio cidicii TaxID=1763883 RepID=UPI0018C2601B|nr:hypothetical protein [Vibrio cidicii]MBG0759240.1 hypothetical protein [Vibrio cidicii]